MGKFLVIEYDEDVCEWRYGAVDASGGTPSWLNSSYPGLHSSDPRDYHDRYVLRDCSTTTTTAQPVGWRIVADTTNSGWAWDVNRVKFLTKETQWSIISSTAACEWNSEGISRTFGSDGFSLEACESKCLATTGCKAIDYYTTGWCNLFDAACSTPRSTHDGASSYKSPVSEEFPMDKCIVTSSADCCDG